MTRDAVTHAREVLEELGHEVRVPRGDANAIVVDMAREVLPVVRETPVLAGVCGTDPFRLMPLSRRAAGEEDLLTAPYVFDPEQAAEMARAGADVLVPHMGLTTGGGSAPRPESVAGFFGASSMERLPTEVAMTETMRRFKAIAMTKGEP